MLHDFITDLWQNKFLSFCACNLVILFYFTVDWHDMLASVCRPPCEVL